MTFTKKRKKIHIHQPDCVLSHAFVYGTAAAGRRGRRRRKKIFNLQLRVAPPLLGLHVQHQSIHSGEILRSLHTRKQRNKHAQYTQNTHVKQALIEPWPHCSLSPFFFPFPFLLSFFLSISPCFSFHM